MGRAAKVIASSMGLTGFAIACFAGIIVGNPANTVLIRSLVCMFACYLLGSIVGAIGEWVVNQHLSEYKARNPIPEYQPEKAEIIEVDEALGAVTQTAQPVQAGAGERRAA